MPIIRDQTERNVLIERLNRLTGEEKAVWGKMNVNQMVSHLVQSGEMPFSADLADRSNFFSRTVIKPLILYVMPMPKEVKTPPDFNQQENGRKPLDFEEDKKLVVDAINKIGELPVDQECKNHPFFGKMNAKEWAIITHKHIDHHLKQFGV